jgi:hypothetical protein
MTNEDCPDERQRSISGDSSLPLPLRYTQGFGSEGQVDGCPAEHQPARDVREGLQPRSWPQTARREPRSPQALPLTYQSSRSGRSA